MFVRTTTVVAQPAGIDRGVAFLHDESMPTLASVDGYVGLSSLIDRHTGRCITATAWQSSEAMHGTEELAAALRGRYVAATGGEEADSAHWEVGLMHRFHNAPDGSA